MESRPTGGTRHGTTGATPAADTRVARMRAAIDRAVSVGPSFLRGDIDADRMASTMVHAVRSCADAEPTAGDVGALRDPEARALQETLAELMTCGSGYLAGRCDAACVARTMTQMVREYGAH